MTPPNPDSLLAPDYSRYARRLLQARPALTARLEEMALGPWSAQSLKERLLALEAEGAEVDGEARLMRALRLLRAEVMLSLIERDLRGAADLAEVTQTMTLLAELAVQHALQFAHAALTARHGRPLSPAGDEMPLLVVGMGKLGGRELNVSSDIDLIFLYEEEGDTAAGEGQTALSCHEFFVRLGRRLMYILSETTADGFVFRVDMRLRPNGASGPLAVSLAMLEEYFLVQGREWERYAWIKGRLISETASSGAVRAAAELDKLAGAFVYRRYLDFGVIDALRGLHAQIRAEAIKKEYGAPGALFAKPGAHNGAHAAHGAAANIKLGRGGIREVEFIAQVFQLIRSGQELALRVLPTLEVLARLAERDLLPADCTRELDQAYRFLRTVEHRLQYLDDAQTHTLPNDPADLERIAKSLGHASSADFLEALARVQQTVQTRFDDIFAAPDLGEGSDNLQEELALAPEAVLKRLEACRASARYRALSDVSRARFDKLADLSIQMVLKQHQSEERTGERAARVIAFLEAIGRRASYLALLAEYPQALARVVHVLSASRWAAGYLTSHPQLLDELLDEIDLADDFDPATYWSDFAAQLGGRLDQAEGNIELQMDLLRQAQHAETFRILLQDLQGRLAVEQISDRLSELADTLLRITLDVVWRQLPARPRAAPRFAVIAYGKLGGKELGYASDLDLIFLYHDDAERAAEIYFSYARKVISWLTSHSAAGTLYEVDTRLRPNGEAGLLVTEMDSFRRYQLREGDNSAWLWEHQALTRARFAAGDAALGKEFEAVRDQVLRQPRDAAALRAEITAMRQRVLDGHPNRGQLFDLKHDRGGMVDIEFIVQYLVLLHGARHAQMTRNSGNIALLHQAGELGLVDKALVDEVADAYRSFRALQHAARLDGAEHSRVEPETVEAGRGAVLALWKAVLEPAG
ncbi:MAG: bifunctional [glutamate--ammonia ligase]-adenylyl-L-tyrosine phosphorylase/[glutamate--ammonia-ligase] adenylyltransferase [Candidatus Protistobacter heckmanni]|nr:bifunctional [glutamate--ammonia ligase]-adenylyl-L-tyrosine phosphorylase/[glutamate--ammonia-ligase] adenylyltransferase [Candidatus Protistobacter heckmanni]